MDALVSQLPTQQSNRTSSNLLEILDFGTCNLTTLNPETFPSDPSIHFTANYLRARTSCRAHHQHNRNDQRTHIRTPEAALNHRFTSFVTLDSIKNSKIVQNTPISPTRSTISIALNTNTTQPTMSSNQSHQSDPKSHTSADTASMLSTSTTSSMTALLKSKFTPKHKSKSPKPDDHLSPGEKQAKRNEGRISSETLATWAAMR